MVRQIVVAVICMCLVLGAGGALTTGALGDWYQRLRKPTWQPPNWLFGPAWTVIGLLSAAAGVLAWRSASDDGERVLTVALFAANGVLNVAWSALFFKIERPDWALVEVVPLWLSVAALCAAFAERSPTAAWLLAPYLVWVAFAAFLNLTIVRLNRPFGRSGIAS